MNDFKQLVADINATEPPRTGRTNGPDGFSSKSLAALTGRPDAGPALRPGEVSSSLRVRMPAETATWWAGLTAFQRGAVVTAAHQFLTETSS